jgi:hypothetical protein
MIVFMFLVNFFLKELELVGVQSAVRDEVSQHLDSLTHIIGE